VTTRSSRLVRIEQQQTTRPIVAFTTNRELLDLRPSYQRGSVWGPRRQRNLIRSIFVGVPIGAIHLNTRRVTDPVRVVDGQQRILAMWAFVDDWLVIPAEWFASEEIASTSRVDLPDGRPGVWFGDLALPMQRRFLYGSGGVQVYETRLPTEDQERELFELINFGGVPQGEQDADCETVQAEEALQ
jgi:hypothetical protein